MDKNRATKSLDRIAATLCEEILMRITHSRVPNSDRRPRKSPEGLVTCNNDGLPSWSLSSLAWYSSDEVEEKEEERNLRRIINQYAKHKETDISYYFS
ncbi:hypothetical protein V1478_002125 [Vespula squamosa]|uniref:Uncharacterized protein n=1 Tax=Vespula squamosa TaxID=30214 RepID=A0ABD2BZ31_VESSQ